MFKIHIIKPRWQKVVIALIYILAISYAVMNYDIIIGFDLQSPRSIIAAQINSMPLADEPTQTAAPTAAPPTVPPSMQPVLALDMHTDTATGVKINNASGLTFDQAALTAKPLGIKIDNNGPQVLFVNTHSSEAFMSTDSLFYDPNDPTRSEDMSQTVMQVATQMSKILESMGIKTVQDTSIHDYPYYNGSYASSLASDEEYLKKYPSIKVILDVHRDAMQRDDGTRIKDVVNINGQQTAQVMVVSGTNANGLDDPHWQDNLAFAIKWQEQMDKDTPELTRPIDLRADRFNTHLTTGSLLVEIGSCANTLDEAVRGGQLAATSLGNLLLGK